MPLCRRSVDYIRLFLGGTYLFQIARSSTRILPYQDNDSDDMNLSWSAFHAHHEKGTSELNPAISSLFPFFEEQAASPAMSRHAMDVQYLNTGQTPVMACDQPLFDITKQIQWISPNS